MTGNKNDKTEVNDLTEPIPSQGDVTPSETAKTPRRSQ